MGKPDEYWIFPRNRKIGDPDWEAAFNYPNALSDEENKEQIHVIEKSAYDALLAENKLMLECLTYIGNGQTRMYLAQEFARACLAKLKESV